MAKKRNKQKFIDVILTGRKLPKSARFFDDAPKVKKKTPAQRQEEDNL